MPREPLQTTPPRCAHGRCSLNKPSTSKLLFPPQITLQREQQPHWGEGDLRALSLAGAAATSTDSQGTLAALWKINLDLRN